MAKIKLSDIDTRAPKELDKKETKEKTDKLLDELDELQNLLYAEGKHSVLVVLQGMDASGKPFIEAAFTRDISADGARLEGVPRRLRPGDILGITFQQKKSRLRVVWVGELGSAEA